MKPFDDFARDVFDRIWDKPREWSTIPEIVPRPEGLPEDYVEALERVYSKAVSDSCRLFALLLREYHQEYIERAPGRRTEDE